MHLDSAISQDGGACFARSLKAVDEENFTSRQRPGGHEVVGDTCDTPENERALFGKVMRAKFVPGRGRSQHKS
jgi:hypothetical protein